MSHARILSILGVLMLLFLTLVPLASAQGGVTVQVTEHPTLGKILTDGQGMTLYLFTNDEENLSNCYDQCAVNWPPLLVAEGEEPVAGAGLTGQLGAIERNDGGRQVTYNGMPLYYFANDGQPGDVNGQYVRDIWFVVHPDVSSMTVANPVVQATEHPSLGAILKSQGMTLYRFTNDQENLSNCYDQCAVNWPPLLVAEGAPVAGTGATGQLGVIERDDGGLQVTYNGLPLYFFVRDSKPTDTNGQGVNDVWFVVDPAEAAPAPAALPETGGSPVTWASILLLALGGLILVGGLGLSLARRML